MPVFRVTYRSTSNPTDDFAPHETELISPKGWDADEVIEAFLNQFPSHHVISCTQIEP